MYLIKSFPCFREQVCEECEEECEVCGMGQCLLCNSSLWKENGHCRQDCSPGFYKSQGNTCVSKCLLCQSCILIDEKMINIKVIVFYVESMIQNVKSYNNEQNVFQKSHWCCKVQYGLFQTVIPHARRVMVLAFLPVHHVPITFS